MSSSEGAAVQERQRDTPFGRPAVDARMLWSGGAAAALVAALVAAVGVLIARGLIGVPVLAPDGEGGVGDASTEVITLGAATGALLATALAHLLLLLTPRPIVFFGWIITLVTVFATLLPFTFDAALEAQLATATLYLCIGVAVGCLVGGVGARAVRRPRSGPRSYDEARGYDQGW